MSPGFSGACSRPVRIAPPMRLHDMATTEPVALQESFPTGQAAGMAQPSVLLRVMPGGLAVLVVLAAETALLAVVFTGFGNASTYLPVHAALSVAVAVLGWSMAAWRR